MEQHISDIAGRIRWGAIAIAAAATLAVGTVAAADDNPLDRAATTPLAGDPPTDPYDACLRAGPMVPDRIVARSEECRLRTSLLYTDRGYVNCLKEAATTPDAMERWVDFCLALAQP